MAYPSTALAASPATHGDVATDVRALGQYGLPVFNVVTGYAATGNGSTDDTTAVNNAITAANASGGIVYFPPGTYSVSNVAWKANVTYLGVHSMSILKIRTGAAYLGSCDSGSASAYVDKMAFINLTFRGLIDTDTTFDQQRHLLNLNGVRDLLIQGCEFIGWHGDAIYLGSSNTGGVERHNVRVKILHNFFDGLTKNNRNCVSIIDGDDILVAGNSATRFCRSDMPGFVDVEPNSGAPTFAVCRNIKVVHNTTTDHNQNLFQLNLPTAMTNPPHTFLVQGNSCDNGAANTNTRLAFLSYVRTSLTDSSPDMDIQILDNSCRNAYLPLEVEGGIIGLTVSGNDFVDCPGASLIGYLAASTTRLVTIANNTFIRCGATDGNVLRVAALYGMALRNNHFHDCATILRFSDGDGATAASDNLDWISNRVTGTTSSLVTKAATHTPVNTANNRRRLYRENGISTTNLTTNFATVV